MKGPDRLWAGEQEQRYWRWAPVGVGTLAFALGLVSLTGQPRSYDERITIETAARSIGGIWHAARTTEAPHLVYYLLMKPWLAAFGSSDWVARFPSVVFGALAAMLLTALGIRLFGGFAGLVAGAALATAPYVMHFSQWARGYSLALFLTVLASYAFARAHDDPRRRWVALWAVAIVAACWVNLFAISVLAAQVAAYLVMRPRPRPRLATAALLAVSAAVTPIIILVATADNGQLNWIPTPTIHRVAIQTWDWSSRNPFALMAAAIGVVALAGRNPTPRALESSPRHRLDNRSLPAHTRPVDRATRFRLPLPPNRSRRTRTPRRSRHRRPPTTRIPDPARPRRRRCRTATRPLLHRTRPPLHVAVLTRSIELA